MFWKPPFLSADLVGLKIKFNFAPYSLNLMSAINDTSYVSLVSANFLQSFCLSGMEFILKQTKHIV